MRAAFGDILVVCPRHMVYVLTLCAMRTTATRVFPLIVLHE